MRKIPFTAVFLFVAITVFSQNDAELNANMVAIKNEYAKEWSFINLNETDPLTKKLLSKELLDNWLLINKQS